MPKALVLLGTDHSGQFVMSWLEPEPPEDTERTRWHVLAEVDDSDELAKALIRFHVELKQGKL